MSFGITLLWALVGLQIRPYVPPALAPEPELTPAPVQVVEVQPANGDWDTNVYARPIYTAPLVGNVARGARARVRGQVSLAYAPYCASGTYYALEPFGYLCSSDAQPTQQPATREPVISQRADAPVPYRYVMVVVEEGSFSPMWASEAALRAGEDPERQLGRGDTVALRDVQPTIEVDGEKYYVSVEGKVLPVQRTTELKQFSEWQGVTLAADEHFPFGWVTPKKAFVYDAPKGKKLEELPRRTRVPILSEEGEGRARWVQIGEGRYMKADQLNEVRRIERPVDTGEHRQWIDIDLAEQVVVAYEGDRPVFATLTSSGRPPNNTPRGNYPVWGKATAITMKSQAYDDAPYFVNRVPWVLFFQAHNALHAAYWHDRFGTVKSHGCANLSPLDARFLFDWLEPALPPGWTAVRYWNLREAPVVHVRNTQFKKALRQDRNIGPPDRADEAERLAAAQARREAKEREEALRAAEAQAAEGSYTPQGFIMNGVPATPLMPATPLR